MLCGRREATSRLPQRKSAMQGLRGTYWEAAVGTLQGLQHFTLRLRTRTALCTCSQSCSESPIPQCLYSPKYSLQPSHAARACDVQLKRLKATEGLSNTWDRRRCSRGRQFEISRSDWHDVKPRWRRLHCRSQGRQLRWRLWSNLCRYQARISANHMRARTRIEDEIGLLTHQGRCLGPEGVAQAQQKAAKLASILPPGLKVVGAQSLELRPQQRIEHLSAVNCAMIES